jgi:hypothetical protein
VRVSKNNVYWVFYQLFFLRSRLRWEISRLPQKPTVSQQLKVSRLRLRLAKQVKGFLQGVDSFLPTLEEVDLRPLEDDVIETPSDEYVEPEILLEEALEEELNSNGEDESEAPSVLPESVVLPLPSNIISAKLSPPLNSLISTERELRKGQANDALEGIRIGLANKSLLLQTDVNQSKSTKQSTRAWAGVRNAQSQILIHAQAYQRAWRALQLIGTADDLLIYQKLEGKDLVVVKDITMAKRFGQGSDALAWFWRIGPSEDELTGEWMEECE